MSDPNPTLRFDFRPEEGDPAPGPRVFRDPVDVVSAHRLDEVLPALARVDAAARAGLWAAGFVAYEAAPAFDSALRVRAGSALPLVWFGLFESPLPRGPEGTEGGASAPGAPGGDFQLGAWTPDVAGPEYRRAIERIRAAIGEGATYQVNYTLRMHASFSGDALGLYDRLRAAQGPAYSAYLDLGATRILSVSPELFFRRRARQVTCRPMKGTARRGRWSEEDRAARSELLASEKDRAENAMIVDLIRSDLGRVSEYGSVHARRVFSVETYPTVHQLTSTIESTLNEGAALVDLFRALFPCGSVTGAPKISTTGFIAELERSPRGVYCGAIGYVEPGGDCVFNVPIRTAVVDVARAEVEYGVGGGVTWDSQPEGEYDEVLAKAEVLHLERPVFSLLETLRADSDGPTRLEAHLSRMEASARYFGYRMDPSRVRSAIMEEWAASQATLPGPCRIRALSDREARVSVEVGRLDVRSPVATPERVALSGRPVSSRDPFLFHKTTHRGVYEIRAAEYPDAFDVLLVNEQGRATEFTRGNLVAEIDGVALTPPLDCGLLGGVFRAHLMARGELRERRLSVVDVRSATRLWLINSVREWVEVELID